MCLISTMTLNSLTLGFLGPGKFWKVGGSYNPLRVNPARHWHPFTCFA